jgi:hypothetical protein
LQLATQVITLALDGLQVPLHDPKLLCHKPIGHAGPHDLVLHLGLLSHERGHWWPSCCWQEGILLRDLPGLFAHKLWQQAHAH